MIVQPSQGVSTTLTPERIPHLISCVLWGRRSEFSQIPGDEIRPTGNPFAVSTKIHEHEPGMDRFTTVVKRENRDGLAI